MTKKEITKDMSLKEVVMKYPETFEVFMKHGLHCIGCHMAQFETLEDGAEAHGLDLKQLLKDLNTAINK